MGLDMYLERFPRYKHYRPEDINAVDSFIEWENDPDASKYTLKEWCGVDEKSLPPQNDVDYFRQFVSTKYWEWDVEHKYPHKRIYEQVAYWRKANAIHKWFVDNVQDGQDDCCYHREVTEKDLKELIGICEEILDNIGYATGDIVVGYTISEDGKWTPETRKGLVVSNPDICERLLPSEDGFFFGSTDYDEYYAEDIDYTYRTLKRVLNNTNFEKQMLFYVSSW